MDGILPRALDGKKRGITWRLQETLEEMEYADDVCLVSHKYEHMQRVNSSKPRAQIKWRRY